MDKFILIKKPPKMEKRSPIHSHSVWKCKMCKTKQASYTCPRCSAPYCSMECYKSSSHQECSEAFYKDCVMENLKDQKHSGKDARKIIELLQQLEKDDEQRPDMSDVKETETNGKWTQLSIDERLQGLDLDTDEDKIWERLTDEEQREFQEFAETSDLDQLVDVWTPWWMREIVRPKIQDLSDPTADSLLANRSDIPPLFPAPDLAALFQRHPPHPSIPCALVNLLYAYALICRLYNGEHHSMAELAAENLLELSVGLRGTRQLHSPQEGILAVLKDADQSTLKGALASREFRGLGMGDVIKVVEDEVFVQAGLSDIRRLLRTAWKAKEKAKVLADAFKKVEYFLGWVEEFGEELEGFGGVLRLQYGEYVEESLKHSRATEIIQQNRTGLPVKNLIEELPS